MPSLEKFEARVNELRDEEAAIRAMDGTLTEGWLKIDAKPVRNVLSSIATKWVSAHTTYLKGHVESSLAGLQQFIADVQEGLSNEVEEGDSDALINAMRHVRNVKLKETFIDGSFGPLKDTCALLKKFGINTPDEVLEELEMIPFKWEDAKKVTLNAREMLGPKQSAQQEKVRDLTETFRAELTDFCAKFRAEAPFDFEVGAEAAYKKINTFHMEMLDMEAKGVDVNAQQELFELAVVPWRDLKACRAELGQLKLAWDHVQLVQDIFASFRATLWSGVDVEFMTDVTKKLQKELKAQPRPLKK
jgi:dynein heavy chain